MTKEREIAARIIDEFENLLVEHEIKLPNDDRYGDENESCIYGSDYYNLEDKITAILYEERANQIEPNRYVIMFRYFDRYENQMKKVHINTNDLKDFDNKLKELKEEYFTNIYEIIYISENLFSKPEYKELFELMNIKKIGEPISLPNDCFFDLDKLINEWFVGISNVDTLGALKSKIEYVYSWYEKEILKENPNLSQNLFVNLAMQSVHDGDIDKNFAPVDRLQSKYYEEDCEIL